MVARLSVAVPAFARAGEMKRQGWLALLFCACACLVSLRLGQDINYDMRGYHLYNAWAVLADRWPQDLFAAGAPTYFHPLLDIAYYLLAKALLPAHGTVLVALAGLPYGILLYLVYLIGQRVATSLALEGWERATFIAASILLAATGAATAALIGTTFHDIPVAALALAGFHQALVAVSQGDVEQSPRRIAAAGILLGTAMGLKLTAAIYVPSLAVAIFAAAGDWRGRARSVAIYSACVIAAFVAVYGPWGWKLYALTGNPFFPMLNGFFHSDWTVSVNIRDERFLPKTWLQGLFYPFQWLTLQSRRVTEVPFRDARFAVTYGLLVAYATVALARRGMATRLFADGHRTIRVLALFIACAYVLWLWEFSVLRYLVAAECLAGIAIMTGIVAIVNTARPDARRMAALSMVAVASLLIGWTVAPRWGRMSAGTDIFAIDAPPLESGALVVFADDALSYVAPGLAARNAGLQFINVPRWFANDLRSAGLRHGLERRLQAKIAQNAGSFYVLFERSSAPPNLIALDVAIDLSSCRPGSTRIDAFLACRGIYPVAPAAVSR